MWGAVDLLCGTHTCTTIHVLNACTTFSTNGCPLSKFCTMGSLGIRSKTVVACILANGSHLVATRKIHQKLRGHACKSLCVCIHVYLFLVPCSMRAQYTFPGFEHEAVDFGINSKLHKTTHISMNQFVTSSTAGEVSHCAWKCIKGISIVTQPSSHFDRWQFLGEISSQYHKQKPPVFETWAITVGEVKIFCPLSLHTYKQFGVYLAYIALS